jgi:hypothetical protein
MIYIVPNVIVSKNSDQRPEHITDKQQNRPNLTPPPQPP